MVLPNLVLNSGTPRNTVDGALFRYSEVGGQQSKSDRLALILSDVALLSLIFIATYIIVYVILHYSEIVSGVEDITRGQHWILITIIGIYITGIVLGIAAALVTYGLKPSRTRRLVGTVITMLAFISFVICIFVSVGILLKLLGALG